MKLLSMGLAGLVITLGAGAWFLEHRSNEELRVEVAALREEMHQLAKPRESAPPAAAKTAEAMGSAENSRTELDRAELKQLRDDLAALKSRTQEIARAAQAAQAGPAKPAESPVPLKLVPASAWKNAGLATPTAAMETILWAAVGGEVDTLADAIAFAPGVREKADAMFAQMSDATRAQYGTPEKLMALMIAKDAATISGLQVLGEKAVGPDDTVLRLRLATEGGQTKEDNFPLHRTASGWRVMLPDNSVEKVARQLLGAQPVAAKK